MLVRDQILAIGLQLGRDIRDIALVIGRFCQRWRHRHGLGRPGLFAGNIRLCWDGHLFDVEQRLASDPIQHEEDRGLVHDGDGGNDFPCSFYLYQCGAWQIQVPDVVMNGLEVPEILPCLGIHGDDGIAEEILPVTVGAPAVEGRRRDWKIDDAPLFIADGRGPDIDTGALSCAVAFPGVEPGFSGTGDRVEGPQKSCRCARRSPAHRRRAQGGRLLHAASRDNDIAEHQDRRGKPEKAIGKAVQHFGCLESDDPFGAETSDPLAGGGIQGDHISVAGRHDHPRFRTGLAGPIGDTAACRGIGPRQVISPDLFARCRIQRHHPPIRRSQEHQTLDHQRGHFRPDIS